MHPLIKINFPNQPLKQRVEKGLHEIFDPVRKIWVLIKPEEWVRQNFIAFLLSLGYPSALIAIERKILVGKMVKRCDIVVYDRNILPFMIIECKKMDVPLSQQVLEQVLRYHIPLQPPYLIITNGAYTMGFRKKNGQFVPIKDFPVFE